HIRIGLVLLQRHDGKCAINYICTVERPEGQKEETHKLVKLFCAYREWSDVVAWGHREWPIKGKQQQTNKQAISDRQHRGPGIPIFTLHCLFVTLSMRVHLCTRPLFIPPSGLPSH